VRVLVLEKETEPVSFVRVVGLLSRWFGRPASYPTRAVLVSPE
jgi:hypothetical protein